MREDSEQATGRARPTEPADTGPLRLSACVRSTPRAVWALAVLFAALMAAYAIAVPAYHGPDETKHVDMLVAVTEPGGWSGAPERLMNQRVVESTRAAGYEPGRQARSAEEAVPRHRRPAMSALGPDGPSTVTSQMWQHPPLGYAVTAAALRVVTGGVSTARGWAHDQVVGMARLLDALVLVPLPLFAYWATRRLGGEPAARSAAVLAVAVPGLAHIGGTVTNDGLVIALVGLATVPLVYVATGDLSARTAVLVGLVAGLALLTKGFALVLPAWIGAAYLLAAWRGGRQRVLPAAGAGTLALGLAAAVGGWWWVRNVRDLGVVQPQGFSPPPAGADFTPDLAAWLMTLSRVTPRTFWGHFGWTEAPLPWTLVGVATAVVAAGVVLALVRGPAGTWRRADGALLRAPAGTWRRADVALLLGALAGTAAIMLYGSWTLYTGSGRQGAMHGRYLMPGLVGLAAAAALGLAAGLHRRGARWLPVVLLAGAVTVHLVAGVVLLERYWMPSGATYRDGLAAVLAWSPWSPAISASSVAAVVAAGGWAAAEAARAARRDRPHPTADHSSSDSAATRLTATPVDRPAGT